MSKGNWKNPVLEGQKYLEFLESEPGLKYRDVAEKFNVSKARVSQMIALVTKLPLEIIEEIMNDCFEKLRLTERKLRPLTLLKTDEEKIEKFREMTDRLQRRI